MVSAKTRKACEKQTLKFWRAMNVNMGQRLRGSSGLKARVTKTLKAKINSAPVMKRALKDALKTCSMTEKQQNAYAEKLFRKVAKDAQF